MTLPKILKIFCLLLIAYCFIAYFPSPVFADAPLTRGEWKSAVGTDSADYTLEDNNQQVYYNLLNSGLDSIVGNEKVPGETGALRSVTNGIAGLIYNQPVSTKQYFADLGSSLGLTNKPVYAAGVGFDALKPVMEIWKAFRNVAYLGFVVIFVVIGFMIMFRTKVNPQTVITVQEALPRIVVTLLLVTFSYAIAGLMIDLIYILIYVIVGVFTLSGLITSSQPIVDSFLNKGLFDLIRQGGGVLRFGDFVTGPGEAIDKIVQDLFGNKSILEAIGDVVGKGVNILAQFILAIALLFTVFKVFISLLMCYIGIIMQVIFAPLTLLFNALPGNNSFGNWIKGLLSNILPFPIIALMFLLCAVIIGVPPNEPACQEGSSTNPWCLTSEGVGYKKRAYDPTNQVWVPPFLQVGGGSAESFFGLIGLGILFMMPKAVEMIKKSLKVEEGAMAGGIPAILSGATAPIRTYQAYKQYRAEQDTKAYQKYMARQARGEMMK